MMNKMGTFETLRMALHDAEVFGVDSPRLWDLQIMVRTMTRKQLERTSIRTLQDWILEVNQMILKS